MEHEHHNHEISGKYLGLSILLNIAISVAQLIGGLISGSMALLTDAAHNFSDVLSLVISYIANRLAKRDATVKQTFGYKRSEIIAAFINSTTLIIIAFIILYNSVELLFTPHEIKTTWVIYLAVASIAVNGLSVLFIKKDAKNNLNMKSAYIHLFSDMLTSVAVLIGGLAMKYFQWYSLDSIFSILIAIYLLYMSYGVFKKSIKILMQFTPEGIDIDEISTIVERIDGVKNIHHIHIWQINDIEIIFEAHIDLHKDIKISEFENILNTIDEKLHKYNIHHLNIQPEFSYNDIKEKIG